MATNLLIGVPDLPLAATVTTSTAPLPSYPAANLFGGNRTDRAEWPGTLTGSVQVQLALGAAASANFLFVGNADWLKGEGVTTVSLHRHTSNSFGASTAVFTTALQSQALYGPNGSDLVATFAATPAAPYWWANYAKSAGAFTAGHSKLLFGTALDLARDPDPGVRVTRAAKAGAFQRRPLLTYELDWSGVPYAQAVQFYRLVARPRRHQPVVLFTTQWHGLLSGHRCLLARVLEARVPPRVTGSNDLKLTVEELL